MKEHGGYTAMVYAQRQMNATMQDHMRNFAVSDKNPNKEKKLEIKCEEYKKIATAIALYIYGYNKTLRGEEFDFRDLFLDLCAGLDSSAYINYANEKLLHNPNFMYGLTEAELVKNFNPLSYRYITGIDKIVNISLSYIAGANENEPNKLRLYIEEFKRRTYANDEELHFSIKGSIDFCSNGEVVINDFMKSTYIYTVKDMLDGTYKYVEAPTLTSIDKTALKQESFEEVEELLMTLFEGAKLNTKNDRRL